MSDVSTITFSVFLFFVLLVTVLGSTAIVLNLLVTFLLALLLRVMDVDEGVEEELEPFETASHP